MGFLRPRHLGPRTARLVAVSLAVTLSAGCALVGLGGLLMPPPTRTAGGDPPGGAATQPAPRAPELLQLSGRVRVGPAGGGAISPLTLSQPLTISQPLTNSAPLTSSQPLVPVALTNSAPLTNSTPLIGNNSASLVSNNSASYRRLQGARGRGPGESGRQVQLNEDRVLFVEVVDPASGQVLARVRAGADGKYDAALDTGGSRPRALIVQATTLVGGQVTSFLAAPLTLAGTAASGGGGGAIARDISPGTTVAAFALARLAGVREQFDVRTGFRGFKTAQLAALVLLLDREKDEKAAAAVDGAAAFEKAPSFDQVLAEAGAGSAALAQAAIDTAATAGGTLTAVVASGNEILEQLAVRGAAATPGPGSGGALAGLVAEAATRVKAEDVAAEAARLAETVKELTGSPELTADNLASLVAAPAPAPTPGVTPTPGTTPSPPASATPAPSASPSAPGSPTPAPSPDDPGSADPTPSPTPAPTTSPPEEIALTVETLAGSNGVEEDADGVGSAARFAYPRGLAIDAAGFLYVADRDNRKVRRVDVSSRLVTTEAGGLYMGEIVSEAKNADGFQDVLGVAVAGDGTVYATDRNIHVIRYLNAGNILTFAGTIASLGLVDGARGFATFLNPAGMAYDTPRGRLIVADESNHAVRAVNALGITSTLAGLGTGFAGLRDGSKTVAQFNTPSGVAVSPTGTVYVADTGNHCIRRIADDGTVGTIAGNGLEGFANGTATDAQFSSPTAIAISPEGDLYIADSGNHAIRKIAAGTADVVTVAGNGTAGFSNGPGTQARFRYPQGLAFGADGTLYVSDSANHCIRAIRKP